MSRFNKEQYSHLRQSLRHMPPANPSLPRDGGARHRSPLGFGNYLTHELRVRKASHPMHNVSDLLHGKSIRNLTKRMRKEKKCKGGRGKREERRDSDYSASLSYASASSSRMNPDSRDYCKQYSSLSEEPLDHQQQQDWVPRDTAYHETTRYSTGNYVLNAEVSQGTFDVDYTKWNETERHPETLPTLQQHVEEKMDSYHPDLGPIQDTSMLPLREPSDRSIDIPGLLDDIILSSKEMGDSVSLTKTLHEMGLKDKLQQMLPEWAGDVLEAAEEDIDPEVLKELVLATVEESQSSETDYDRKRPAMHPQPGCQPPVEEDKALQHLVDEIKRRPSTDFDELEVEKFANLLRGKSTEEHGNLRTDAGILLQ